MSADHILLVDEAAPGIRVLTLNRPDKRNALSTALLAAVVARCPGGLVSECVQAGSALARVMEIAGEIAAGAPPAAISAKQCVLRAFDCGLSCGLALEQRTMLNVAHSKDRAEGLAAFLERRAPRFIGQRTEKSSDEEEDSTG